MRGRGKGTSKGQNDFFFGLWPVLMRTVKENGKKKKEKKKKKMKKGKKVRKKHNKKHLIHSSH